MGRLITIIELRKIKKKRLCAEFLANGYWLPRNKFENLWDIDWTRMPISIWSKRKHQNGYEIEVTVTRYVDGKIKKVITEKPIMYSGKI